MSLDALRGFDMFWIIGADSLVRGLRGMSDTGFTGFLTAQLQHAKWEGFRFYDLIYPLFVFIVGVAAVFSLSRIIEREGRTAAVKRIVRRSILLFALGIFSSAALPISAEHPADGRVEPDRAGVFVYGFVVLFSPHAGVGGCLHPVFRRLLGDDDLPAFPDVRPTPDTAVIARETGFTNTAQLNLSSTNLIRGVFDRGVNLACYVDQKYLPGSKYDGTWDWAGLLSTLGVIGSCLLGVFAGLLLKNPAVGDRRKVVLLVSFGIAGVALGWLWVCNFR